MRHQGTGDRDRISAKSLPPSSCRSFTTHQQTEKERTIQRHGLQLGASLRLHQRLQRGHGSGRNLVVCTSPTAKTPTVNTEIEQLGAAARRKGLQQAGEALVLESITAQVQLLQTLQAL